MKIIRLFYNNTLRRRSGSNELSQKITTHIIICLPQKLKAFFLEINIGELKFINLITKHV